MFKLIKGIVSSVKYGAETQVKINGLTFVVDPKQVKILTDAPVELHVMNGEIIACKKTTVEGGAF